MAKKKNDNLVKIIIVALILFFLFGANCTQTAPAALSGGVPIGGGAPSGGGGGGISGGAPTPPPANESGDDGGMANVPMINFCALIPSLCAPPPTGDDPYAPTPDLSPENGGAMTQDPCVLNPNMVGCGDMSNIPTQEPTPPAVQPPIWGSGRIYGVCQGISYGMPQMVTHYAWGDSYTSFECTGNRDCGTYPPAGYYGRPQYLVCCSGECWDQP